MNMKHPCLASLVPLQGAALVARQSRLNGALENTASTSGDIA